MRLLNRREFVALCSSVAAAMLGSVHAASFQRTFVVAQAQSDQEKQTKPQQPAPPHQMQPPPPPQLRQMQALPPPQQHHLQHPPSQPQLRQVQPPAPPPQQRQVPTPAARAIDQGVNVLEFGADPTGSADSTAAIQAAIDYTMTNKPRRAVVCPDGTYKVSAPIYLDPPGSMRGADGTNGPTYNAGVNYNTNQTVNYLGVPYYSIQNNNINNTPTSSPTWWQPLNWSAGTTYASGNLVRYNGVIWKSTQNSNLANTPSVTGNSAGNPWVYWAASPTANNFSGTFTGLPGLDNTANAQGCQLSFTYSNGPGFIVGAIDGNYVGNMTLFGPAGQYHGLQPRNGIGVAISSDGGGANNTTIENMGIYNFYTLIQTGWNGDGLGAQNTFRKVTGSNCVTAISINNSQNDINNSTDNGFNCLNLVTAVAGPGIGVYNSDFAPSSTQNIFTIAPSSLTGFIFNNIPYYTFTATLSGGCTGGCGHSNNGSITSDPNIANCTRLNPTYNNNNDVFFTSPGSCVYNTWVIKLPGWGPVPMQMFQYNPSTHVAQFQIFVEWQRLFYGQMNLITGCPASCGNDFRTEMLAATTIYAVERAVELLGTGLNVSAAHVEPDGNGVCLELLNNTTTFNGDHGVRLSNIRANYDIDGSGFAGVGATDTRYGIFQCQESLPFMQGDGTGGGWTMDESSFYQGGTPSPALVYFPGSGGGPTCVMGNMGLPMVNVVSGGACYWTQSPFKPSNGLGGSPATDIFYSLLGLNVSGWLPTQQKMTTPVLNTLLAVNSSTTLPTPPFYGNSVYTIADAALNGGPTGPNFATAKQVYSSHSFFSYGKNFTTSDTGLSGLSWSYIGGTDKINMDSASLGYMFPGLMITLNNGVSGAVHYLVTGVYPSNSLDGTHPGYIVVCNATQMLTMFNGGAGCQNTFASQVTSGTVGTTYTTTGSPHGETAVIGFDPFNFTYVGGATIPENAKFTAVAGGIYPIDTTSAAVTATLPASPIVGQTVQLLDAGNLWATNNVTVARNGTNINGSASNLTLSTNGQTVLFSYINPTIGWRATTY
jgi:hypothetical protein